MKQASYPSCEYHAAQDDVFLKYSSPMGFAFAEVNDFIELMAYAVPDDTGKSYGYPTPQEFVEALVQLHNRCVENINKGQSVPRYNALLWETRLRMKGAIADDSILDQIPGLIPLELPNTL